MICFLTERRLKPGAWDGFRAAWDSGEPPPVPGRAYHVRDIRDPDHIVSFGLFDVELSEFTKLGADPAFGEMQAARAAAMAPFIAEIGADGIFEVIEVVEEPGPSH